MSITRLSCVLVTYGLAFATRPVSEWHTSANSHSTRPTSVMVMSGEKLSTALEPEPDEDPEKKKREEEDTARREAELSAVDNINEKGLGVAKKPAPATNAETSEGKAADDMKEKAEGESNPIDKELNITKEKLLAYENNAAKFEDYSENSKQLAKQVEVALPDMHQAQVSEALAVKNISAKTMQLVQKLTNSLRLGEKSRLAVFDVDVPMCAYDDTSTEPSYECDKAKDEAKDGKTRELKKNAFNIVVPQDMPWETCCDVTNMCGGNTDPEEDKKVAQACVYPDLVLIGAANSTPLADPGAAEDTCCMKPKAKEATDTGEAPKEEETGG